MDSDAYKLHKFKSPLQEELEALQDNKQVILVDDDQGVL